MQANLDQAYLKKRMYQSYLYGVNTHNQFLSWWLSRGILGVVVYTGMLIWGFYKAFSAKDPLWIGFLVLVTLVSFSENLLEVQHGLFFMAFFFSFFPFTQRRSHE
jgi:O-antigen ligase